jgi:glycosyltransferase involved in cell wall biosynthesis
MSSISVVIPTYNYGCFIAEAIESVLSQTVKPNEVIVVDDGSTDDTEAKVGRFIDKILYIKQENKGVCTARNRGVAESSGDYILFQDADDTSEPTRLEKQLAIFQTDHEIGLVHCGLREFSNAANRGGEIDIDGMEGWVADDLLLWERPVIVGPGGTIMITRKVFDAVGGFDENLRVGEDWDFCYWVARKFKVGFVPEPLVNYRIHAGAAHNNIREMERGMARFYEKAFAESDPKIRALKNRAYGNFHRILAGSYFQSGNYAACIKHAAKSIGHRPSGIGYFLKFPIRRLRNGRKPQIPF